MTSQHALATALTRLGEGEVIEPPDGNPLPKHRHYAGMIIERDPKVVQFTLQRANGICELCDSPAPFTKHGNDQPYLEIHHIHQLADGGPDRPENTVALCPNCHKRVHFGSDREEVSQQLRGLRSLFSS